MRAEYLTANMSSCNLPSVTQSLLRDHPSRSSAPLWNTPCPLPVFCCCCFSFVLFFRGCNKASRLASFSNTTSSLHSPLTARCQCRTKQIFISENQCVYTPEHWIYKVKGTLLVSVQIFVSNMNTYTYWLKRRGVRTMRKSCHLFQYWHLARAVRRLQEGLKFYLKRLWPLC